MKILYFTIQINEVGGLARIVIDKINWLVAHGYDISLCDIENLDVKPAYPIDSRVKLVRGDLKTTPGNAWIRLKGTLATIGRLKEIINQEQPDVIVNAHTPLITWILPFVCKDIPKVMEIHQSRQALDVFDKRYLGKFDQWLHRFSIRWIYGQYDKFIVLTHGDQICWHLKNCMVIPNFSNYVVNDASLNPLESKNVIMLARLAPQKRVDLMIRVWAKVIKDCPDWQLNVLGDGIDYDSLKQQIADAGIESSFHLKGAVKDVTKDLESSSILCLTSEYEGFGIVLIEAMLKGIPVIAFEYVGVHDIIEDGKDGCIVSFGDIDAYAERLKYLMTSKEERLRLRDNAFQSVQKFNKEKIMQKWVDLFTSLMV